MNSDRKMRLAAYYNPTGHHVASWRHPRADADAHVNIQHYIKIAQTAEKAKFDLIFLADGVATRQADIEAQSRSVQFIANFEPLTLLSALAMVTEKIGLICTMAADTISGYIQGLLDGVEFKQTAYALDRVSRKAALARFLRKAMGEEDAKIQEEELLAA